MARLSLQFPSLQVRRSDFKDQRTYSAIFNIVRSIQDFTRRIADAVNYIYGDSLPAPTYNVADLPDASTRTGHIVYVPDESGGAALAVSDGTDWHKITLGGIVS